MAKATREIKANPIKDIMDKSVIALLSFSRLQPKRTISTDDIDAGKADKTMLHVAKDLVDSEELRKIAGHDHETALWFRKRCAYSPITKGFILPLEMVTDAFDYVDKRRAGRDELVAAFAKAYPKLIEDAKKRLGPLFDASEYPAKARIAGTFAMDFVVVDWSPTPTDKLSKISKAFANKNAAEASKKMSNMVETVELALAAAFADPVKRLVENLGGADDGKKKRLHKSALAAMEEFLESFKKRNLSDNVELERLYELAKKAIAGVDIDQLRKSEDVRSSVAKQLSDVSEALNKMTEDAPKRRMSLKDEEV